MNFPPFVEPIELPSVRAARLRRRARQQNRRRWLARSVGLLLTLAVIAVVLTRQASAAPPIVGTSWSVSVGPVHAGVHAHGKPWHVPPKKLVYVKPGRPVVHYRTYYGPTHYAPLPPAPLPPNVLLPSSPVEIANPAHNLGVVRYRVGGRVGSLSPGQAVTLPYGGNRVIEFHRGGSFGRAQYRLTSGAYRFEQTDHGWELYRQ